MASLPSSDLTFFDPRGEAWSAAPREWQPALLVLPVHIDRWASVRAFRGGEPMDVSLRHVEGAPRVAARWERAGAGHHRVSVVTDAGATEFVVTVAPSKIDAAAFERLLDDLRFALPAEVALGLDRAGARAGVSRRPRAEVTLAGELERLRRVVLGTDGRMGLADVLVAIGREPYARLATDTVWSPQERARRPDVTQWSRALARAANRDEDGGLRTVPDRRAWHTLDVYENRVVRAYVMLVRHRLEVLRGATRGRAQLVGEVDAMTSALEGGVRHVPWLREVGLLGRAPSEVTMVLARNAPYRAALEGLMTLLRSPTVQLSCPALDAPLANLPSLYQLWATLVAVATLLEQATALGYRVTAHRLVQPTEHGSIVTLVPDGKVILALEDERGVRAALIPERRYLTKGRLRSVSFEQRPDVVLEVERNASTLLWILDPKYKLDADADASTTDGRPCKADIDKMHAYRDAIRDTAGQRVVQHAAILYPGPDAPFDDGIAALRALPGQDSSLRDALRELFARALR
jgi:hypothetical protein